MNERSGYILASLFAEVASIDKRYRDTFGLPPQPKFQPTYIEASSEFPLCDRFVSAAEFYLASLLVIETDEGISDSFYAKYCESICSITKSIPAALEKTLNVY